ncbi:MAG: lactoylglutathione lyase [Candidatus Cloacimonadota bacterium]|nr:MAG: lactoylglutathione lyase [Candidatus Cloacimonadota bacterium]
MIDHVTIAVSDVEKSKLFYEAIFKPLAYKLSFGEENIFYAFEMGKGFLFEIAQYKGKTPITGTHIAFRVDTKEKVDSFFELAIKLGAKDNGKPGPRPEYTKNYYACFFYDLDGHNIEAVFDVFEKE